MRAYTIEYYENGPWETVKRAHIAARSKEDAYYRFMLHNNVYAAWVRGCTYNNGNYKLFNTFCGNPT